MREPLLVCSHLAPENGRLGSAVSISLIQLAISAVNSHSFTIANRENSAFQTAAFFDFRNQLTKSNGTSALPVRSERASRFPWRAIKTKYGLNWSECSCPILSRLYPLRQTRLLIITGTFSAISSSLEYECCPPAYSIIGDWANQDYFKSQNMENQWRLCAR